MGDDRLILARRAVTLVCTVCGCRTVLPYYARVLQEFPCAGCDAIWDMALDEHGRILQYEEGPLGA